MHRELTRVHPPEPDSRSGRAKSQPGCGFRTLGNTLINKASRDKVGIEVIGHARGGEELSLCIRKEFNLA